MKTYDKSNHSITPYGQSRHIFKRIFCSLHMCYFFLSVSWFSCIVGLVLKRDTFFIDLDDCAAIEGGVHYQIRCAQPRSCGATSFLSCGSNLICLSLCVCTFSGQWWALGATTGGGYWQCLYAQPGYHGAGSSTHLYNDFPWALGWAGSQASPLSTATR
jgi:hypothetical protein